MHAELLGQLFYLGAVVLVMVGMLMLVRSHHLLRALLGLTLLEAGVNLFLVAAGFRPDAAAPIAIDGNLPAQMVDPIPQALILTAIVIGVGVLGLALALAVRLHEERGTLWLPTLRRESGTPASTQLPSDTRGDA